MPSREHPAGPALRPPAGGAPHRSRARDPGRAVAAGRLGSGGAAPAGQSGALLGGRGGSGSGGNRGAGPTPDHRLTAPPSGSAAQIEALLAAYSSPAAGCGTIFYDVGVSAGMDPAYALAFYSQERRAGTQGVARAAHSIGHIRITPGYASFEESQLG